MPALETGQNFYPTPSPAQLQAAAPQAQIEVGRLQDLVREREARIAELERQLARCKERHRASY